MERKEIKVVMTFKSCWLFFKAKLQIFPSAT